MSEHQGPAGPPDWPFSLPRRLAVVVERAVMERLRLIAHVYRDADDDGFQFLSDGEKAEGDAMMVGLEEVFELDPTIGQLASLPPGWRATRGGPEEAWVVEPWIPDAHD